MRKPRLLVLGSFVMDLIAVTEQVPVAGQTVFGREFRTAPGGKGANQAVQCARLGADVVMMGCVGSDVFGRELLDAARAAGVNVSPCVVHNGVSSGVGHILLEVSALGVQNRITAIPGANFTLLAEEVAWLEREIATFDMVLLQLEVSMEANLAVARFARDAGVPVMLNPAPARPMPPDLLACTTYLSPNETEATALTGLPFTGDGSLPALTRSLRDMGPETVIVTMGGSGSAVADGSGITRVPVVPMPQVVDPTGAGDSFVAAFCVALTAGLPQADALTFASHTAALTVSRMGAMPSLPTLAEVQALLAERGCSDLNLRRLAGGL